MVAGLEQEEAYAQLEEAVDKLTEVAHELDIVKQAVRQAGSADAEHLRQQAASTIEDVASMLRAHGPAAAIAEASSRTRGRQQVPAEAPSASKGLHAACTSAACRAGAIGFLPPASQASDC